MRKMRKIVSIKFLFECSCWCLTRNLCINFCVRVSTEIRKPRGVELFSLKIFEVPAVSSSTSTNSSHSASTKSIIDISYDHGGDFSPPPLGTLPKIRKSVYYCTLRNFATSDECSEESCNQRSFNYQIQLNIIQLIRWIDSLLCVLFWSLDCNWTPEHLFSLGGRLIVFLCLSFTHRSIVLHCHVNSLSWLLLASLVHIAHWSTDWVMHAWECGWEQGHKYKQE